MDDPTSADNGVAYITEGGVKLDVTGTDRATGIAYTGDYPTNRLMRAEALSRAGLSTDPDDLVTEDAIADAGARLADEDAERAERERAAAAETPSLSWSRDALVEYAARHGAAHEETATKAVILDAINLAAAAANPEG